MFCQNKNFRFKNFDIIANAEALADRKGIDAAALIRLVVAELPEGGMASGDIVAAMRAAYPNAQIMFVAPPAAAMPAVPGAAMPAAADVALMLGLPAEAARVVPLVPEVVAEAVEDAEALRRAALVAAVRKLPPRQSQVAACLVRGLSNKGIAREMGLSESTVKVYVVSIFRILGVHSRASAISTILGSPDLRCELGA